MKPNFLRQSAAGSLLEGKSARRGFSPPKVCGVIESNAELYAKIQAQAEKDRREREEAWEAEKARRRAAGNFYTM